MNAKDYLIDFESKIKGNFLSINKYKDKDNKNWKLIYSIEGMNINTYIPYCEFIFYLNNGMDDFSENVVMIGNGKSYVISDIDDDLFTVLENDNFINDYREMIMGGVTEINKIVQNSIDSFEQIPNNSKMPMSDRFLYFVFSTTNNEYDIQIKADMSEIIIDNEKIKINNINDIFKTIAKKIDE